MRVNELFMRSFGLICFSNGCKVLNSSASFFPDKLEIYLSSPLTLLKLNIGFLGVWSDPEFANRLVFGVDCR